MAANTFSPKIEIINYFDELINLVDIDIERSLIKYKRRTLGQLECFEIKKRSVTTQNILCLFESSENNDGTVHTVDLWSESTKVVDYLSQVRMRTIEELRKAQEETLENYKLNSSLFKSEQMTDKNKIEELRSKLFAEKFYFQVRLTSEDYKPWIFNVFTFVTDFYMSQSDIDTLK